MDCKTYISIDVAIRSLAIGVYRMKPFKNIDSYKCDNAIEMNDQLDSIIQPLFMKVFDINHGTKAKETTIIEKANALKYTLTIVDEEISQDIINDNIIVLIEYQMNANHGSNAIFNMIMYHYANRYPIEIIKPSWKNMVALHPLLCLSTFLASASNNYKANKEHTRTNMIYLLTLIDKLDYIKNIKKNNLDDIADTLMQAIAFHQRN